MLLLGRQISKSCRFVAFDRLSLCLERPLSLWAWHDGTSEASLLSTRIWAQHGLPNATLMRISPDVLGHQDFDNPAIDC